MPGQEIQSVSKNPWKLSITLQVKADDIPSNISQNGHLIVKFKKKTANGTFVELKRETIKLNLSQCEQFVGLSIEENLPETISFVFILVREGLENRELQLQICDFRQTAFVDFKEEKLKLTVHMASKSVKRTAIQTQLIHPCPLSITLYVNSNNMPFNDLTTGQLTITFQKKTSTDGFQELKSEIMTLNSATCNTEVRHIFVDGLESIFIVFALRRKGSHKEEKRLVMSDLYQTTPINLTDIKFSIRLRSVTPTDIFSKPENWLSEEEKEFRGWRRNHVMASIQKIYPENGITKDIHVPNIAVIGSGGGIRAVMGMCGAMTALQEADILDCTMHIAGLSGSAWYLTTLYAEHQPNLKEENAITEDQGGFQRLLTRLRAKHGPNQEEETSTLTQSEGFKKSLGLVHAGIRMKLQKFRGLQGGLEGGLHGCLRKAWSLWKYYTTSRASNEGMFFTMTNVFGEVIGDVLLGEKSKNKRWSEQRLKLKAGALPLPLIAALHVRNEKTIKEHHAWIEMSPFQAHIWRYGVSIGMAHFGNQYYAGFCKKTYAEPPLHFLQGVCGSAYAFVKNHKPEENKWYMFVGKIKDWTWKIFNTFDHLFIAKMPTFLYGLHSFKACHPELASIDDDRIDSETQEMMLVDAGIAFNSPYPTVLRPGRKVDMILSFDFSDRGDDDAWPFEELEKAAVWAKKFHVPFPNIEARLKVIKENVNKENENNRKYEYEEVYVFTGYPNVVHFVMINKSYRGKGNDQDHDFNIHRNYPTLRFCYSEEEFDWFSGLIQHNVTKNKELIIKEIRRAINRKIKKCQILEDNKRRKIEERRTEQEEKDRIDQEQKDRIEPEKKNRIE